MIRFKSTTLLFVLYLPHPLFVPFILFPCLLLDLVFFNIPIIPSLVSYTYLFNFIMVALRFTVHNNLPFNNTISFYMYYRNFVTAYFHFIMFLYMQ